MHTLNIDIETYSSVDLTKCGVYKYVEAPDFTVLMIAMGVNDEPVVLLDMTDRDSDPVNHDAAVAELVYHLINPNVLKTAHNASFERTCLAKYFGIELPPEQWSCTLVKAAMLGLPLSLDAVAKVLHLSELKDAAGKALIKFFCVPRKPTKNDDRLRNMPADAPEKWEAFKGYCIQDVRVEQAIRAKIDWFTVPPAEQALWCLDQRINDRGVMLYWELVDNAIRIDKVFRDRLTAEAFNLTGLSNPNSAAQLKEWLADETGTAVTTLRKDDLPGLLKGTDDENVKRVIEIRQEMAKTSIKKYLAMLKYMCRDERARGLFQFYGANRTGRWAGRGIQMQNLPRISYGKKSQDLQIARDLVLAGDGDEIQQMFGNVADTLSQLIRTAFIPRPGCRFIVADFSAIEARVIAWLADEQWRLDVFRNGGDIYVTSAAAMFKIPIENVTDELRQRGKVAELACGFGGGKSALEQMDIKKVLKKGEHQPIVKAWREGSPNIVQLWRTAQAAAIAAVEDGQVHGIGFGVSYFYQNNVLFAQLPSGRCLAYQRPKITTELKCFVTFLVDKGVNEKGQKALLPVLTAQKYEGAGLVSLDSEPRPIKSLSFEGWIQDKNMWGNIHTYGGSLVENLVQAIARDCLAHAMTTCDNAGFDIVAHVHDEIILEVPVGQSSLEEVCELMSLPISWAEGLPLGADGFEGFYYKK